MPTAEVLSDVLDGFAQTPQETRQILRDWLEHEPVRFRESVLEYLKDFSPGAGSDFLLHLLAARGLLDELVWEAMRGEFTSLPSLLGQVKSVDPDFTIRATQGIVARMERDAEHGGDDLKPLMRMLTLTGPDRRLLPYLARLTSSSDPHTASKAALLAGKLIRSGDWFNERLRDPDARVRANAVEALWGLEQKAVIETFELATRDPAPRPAANAWLGLYRAGQIEALRGLAGMAANPDPGHQVSGAWAMGRSGDPRFLPVLRTLLQSSHPAVVKIALASLRTLARHGAEQGASAHPPRLWKREKDGAWATWSILLRSGTKPRDIDWRVESAAGWVLEMQANFRGPAQDLAVAVLLPAPLPDSPAGWAECKREADFWARVPYDPRRRCPRVNWNGQILRAAQDAPIKFAEDVAFPVHLTRDLRAWHTPVPADGSLPSLPAAMAAAIAAVAHAWGQKHVVALCGEGVDPAYTRDLVELLQLVSHYMVHLHFLVPRKFPRRLAGCCRGLTQATQGWFRQVDEPETQLADLLQALAGCWQVRIDTEKWPGPWQLSLPDSPAPLSIPAADLDWEG